VKSIVIIGGGFCGVFCAKELDSDKYNVTLIDPRDAFENKPYIYKLLTDKSHTVSVPYTEIFSNVKHIKGKATRVEKDCVVVNDGNTYSYDFLVIATGSITPIRLLSYPRDRVAVIESVKGVETIREKIKDVNSIGVVGGGFTGVEVTGELMGNKFSLNLVHSHNRLMERLPVSVSDYIHRVFKKGNVKIFTNTRVESFDGKNVFLQNKKSFRCDFLIWCAGIKARYPALFFEPEVNGFQQKNFPRIFFGGDALPIDFEKNGKNGVLHGKLIGKSIKRIIRGKPALPLRFEKKPMIESIGRKYGVLVWGPLVIKGRLAGWLKRITDKLIIWSV